DAPVVEISRIIEGEDSIKVLGFAHDNDSWNHVIYVEVRIDDGSWNIAIGTEQWFYMLDASVLSNGNHTIYVRAYDGYEYSKIATAKFRMRNAKVPEVCIATFFDVIYDTTEIYGYAKNVEWVEVRVDEGEWMRVNVTNSEWKIIIEPNDIGEGWHTLYVRGYNDGVYGDTITMDFYVGNGKKVINNWLITLLPIIISAVLALLFIHKICRSFHSPAKTYKYRKSSIKSGWCGSKKPR
ncbi:MAG: hypothetical protein DRN20_04340, partial [Thermoplasmata archaeon]